MAMGNENMQQPNMGAASQGMSNPYQNLPPGEQAAAFQRDLEAARKRAEEHLDQAQRAQAELVNFRRRTDEDRLTQQKYSNGRLLTKLLPLADEIDLAISHAGGQESAWLEGFKLIQRKLSGLLDSEGVAKINAAGVMFNPVEHEALELTKTNEYPSGYVIKVVRSGYKLHDRVIQPAQVVVAQ